MPSEKEDLAELGRYAFSRLRDRLSGLPDDEFTWEPAPGVATIAWRLGHIADLLAEERNATWLGVPGPVGPGPAADAAGALLALDAAFAVWTTVLSAVPESSLAEPIGPVGGPHADSTRRAFVLHVLDELIHHGAEVALVRDLWEAKRGTS
ncbi:DinB family protein [Petropleomorpha daqingensis]|uniref:Putative damage-inducible protein DinB n=1 Tax=Petropleomorpha daqingensis TaxID=2026353 RepID=A0A853CBU5_9ACTN|nr:DinB family protein [Petropleomorpha daqingensis]NYJ05380.1 putative damage-inducible protein DinB [Petropleomorpha daqingensis]